MNYITQLTSALYGLDKITIEAVAREIHKTRGLRRRVFIFGNGGSMAVASHLACDLSKNTRKPKTAPVTAVSFDNLATLTALANDEGYGHVFDDQLIMHGAGLNDIVIGITTSGRSENVLRALHHAARVGATTVVITGSTDPVMDSFTYKILTAAPTIEMKEDLAGIVGHMLTVRVRELGE